MDKYFYFYCFIVLIGFSVFTWQQVRMYRCKQYERFKAICNDKQAINLCVMPKFKLYIAKLFKNILFMSYLVYCISKILYGLGLWSMDVWTGLLLFSLYLFWQQFIYVSVEFITRRYHELYSNTRSN